MSKFIGHWYKSKHQEMIYKVISHFDKKYKEDDMPFYLVDAVWSDGRTSRMDLYITDSTVGTQIDAAKARAWKRYVTSVRGIATYKFNKL